MQFGFTTGPGPRVPFVPGTTLAYWDTFQGLIPCRIICAKENNGLGGYSFKIKLTAGRGPYKSGEELNTNALHVVPRERVRRRKYSTSILPYQWVAS